MSAVFSFKPTPLSLALTAQAVSLLFFAVPSAQALTQVNSPATNIMSTTPLDDYLLNSGSGLIATGARTIDIAVENAFLRLQSGSQSADINARDNSRVEVDASRVIGRTDFGLSATGNTNVFITNNSVVSNDFGSGVTLARTNTGTDGSHVTVENSRVVGTLRGITAGSYSTVALDNAQVEATDAAGSGLMLINSSAVVRNNSVIIGGDNGVNMLSEANLSLTNSLVLDNSVVQGRTGPAILVDPFLPNKPLADIQVLNGSNLLSGNGVLLQVSNNATANMNVDNSRLTGDVVIDAGSTGTLQLNNNALLTGQLRNVAQLDANSGGKWMLVGDSAVGALRMGGGSVEFGGPTQFFKLDTNSLAGNGTFVMHTNFNNGETDLLNVNGTAEGSHELLIAASGNELAVGEPIMVVHTQGGGAQFGLVGDTVDVGAFSYGLKQEGTDWYLDTERRGTSNSAQAALALANAAPTVILGEASILRTRMGELRFSQGKSQGLWMRSYGNKYDVAATGNGLGYKQNQSGLTIGVDTPVEAGDGQWLVGVMGGYSKSDLSLSRGSSGMVNSYHVGAYATWLEAETGLYVDLVGKVNRLNNQSQVNMSDGKRAKGNYTQDAVSASVEVGRHIKLDDDFFVEPYTQLSTSFIGGSGYTMDNGLKVDGDRTKSIVGKVGVTAGKNIQLDSGTIVQPYVRTAAVREFNDNNKVFINNQAFNNDLSGSRYEVAGGMSVSFSENLSMHAEIETSKGKAIDMPWGGTVGLRYAF